MALRPLHDRVIVKRLDNERTTASGIVIPDSAAEKPDQGEVLAVGPGKKTEDEILYEFMDTFEQHHSENKADARDGTVTKGEWVEYYNNVSMSVDRDDYFELMMNNTWNLKGDRVTKKGWGAEV